MFGIKPDRIELIKNGIQPERFKGLSYEKQKGRVVFSSSADRGLERAIYVMDQVVKEVPEATLHVYYGFDNMAKNGLTDQVKKLQGLMCDRPYIHYHGNVQQDLLARELAKAQVWLYPANFLETFFIGGLEMQACKVYGVLREWGAIPDTMRQAKQNGWCDIIDSDCVTPEEIKIYADATIAAIKENKCERIQPNPEADSWENEAKRWVETLGLSR
jgi:glycosyltransferase involved in cell wall biosynthesis